MTHSHVDASVLGSDRGIKALYISFAALMVTAAIQGVVVYFSGSAALLADTIHNVFDALSAVPLWLAFLLGKRKPDRHFTYGYSRLEDLAGVIILLLIFASAGLVGYESWGKIKTGYVVRNVGWVVFASIIGYLGNEAVAQYRIRIGKSINSAALVADGYHARADALTSLGVLVGAVGVYFGYPLADPIMGLVIMVLILRIGWNSSRELFDRLADAIPPEKVEDIKKITLSVKGVLDVYDIRARYVGQFMRVDLTIAVKKEITVIEGHEIAIKTQFALQEKFAHLISPMIHVDPEGHTGEEHHFQAHHKPD